MKSIYLQGYGVPHLGTFDIKTWPYREAARITPHKDGRPTVFQTGYGPSGPPTIATFAEVYRTTLVRKAFEDLHPGVPTRLIVFSDDLDALRSVPENVPNQDMLRSHLGISLSSIPDPFGKHESFAHHNNAMLRSFLDRFGFEYDFLSATEMYARDPDFKAAIEKFLIHHDEIVDIVRPTLGPDRAETYSPFMPIDQDTKRVYEAKPLVIDPLAFQQMRFELPASHRGTHDTSVYHGHCKLQWKADWAMRWLALGVDYEMCGKDLTDSYTLSSAIVRAVGGRPPVNMIYEMFLDEEGKKISKSKGNGLTIEEWLDLGTEQSLRYYLFQSPQKAKELSARVVARTSTDMSNHAARYDTSNEVQMKNSPIFYVTGGEPLVDHGISFDALLNVARTVVPKDPATLAAYIEKSHGIDIESEPYTNALITGVFSYYWGHAADAIQRRDPTPAEMVALKDLFGEFEGGADEACSAEEFQTLTYEVGKRHYAKEDLRQWFAALYQILLGQDSGPRFGNFVKLLGYDQTMALIGGVTGKKEDV